MNSHVDRDSLSGPSREAFLAYIHEYLVQSGCMQTADALTKETNVRPTADIQDTFFYDWWCSLLNSHNFSGVQPQEQDIVGPSGWGNGPLALDTPDNLAPFKAFMNTEAFKVPTNSAAAPATVIAAPKPRTSAKPKAKARKTSANGKVAKKGSPILVPGVAPLVMPRKSSNSSIHTPSVRNGSSSQNKSSGQQPNTPQWDSAMHTAENSAQRAFNQMPEVVETPGVQKQKQKPQLNSKKTRKNAHEKSSKGQPLEGPATELQPLDQQKQQQQFLHHQQMLHQQQFLHLQQQQQQQQAQAQGHANGPSGLGTMPTRFIGGNPSMVPPRGGASMVDGHALMLNKPDHLAEVMGNPTDTKFLDDMMNSNLYVNGSNIGFPTDPQMDGLGFGTGRPMVNGNEFPGNTDLYAPLQTQSKEPDFEDKAGDHAGMIDNSTVSGENFMNANFGFDANAPISLGASEDHGMPHGGGQGNYRGGTNYGFAPDGGSNGDFFLEPPLTMSL